MTKIKWYQRINPFFWLERAMCLGITHFVERIKGDILYSNNNLIIMGYNKKQKVRVKK